MVSKIPRNILSGPGSLIPESIFENHLRTAVHLATVGVPVGIIVGTAIAGYDYTVNTLLWDTFLRHFPPQALCLLPIAGMLLTGIILSAFRVSSPSMADEVVRAYHNPEKGIEYRTAIPKLAASVATMGFGCSAGMEGASKWLGGTIASFIQAKLNKWNRLRFTHAKVETMLLAGAAAGIGAIFRAPLTGAIMGIESPYKHDLAHEALLHALVTSAVSYATFSFLRTSSPYFPIHFKYVLHVRDLLLCIPLGILAGLSSHFFLGSLRSIKQTCNRWGAPILMKYALGGAAISSVAWMAYFIAGEPATLQAGLPVANRLLNGQYALGICLFLFLAKLMATSFTFGMGGVGGLFVPSATIGAALGAACDVLFHPSQPGLFTLVGIAAFTGASYNSLLFSAVFIAEASGSPALVVPGLLASSAAFLVSAGVSNSQSQHPMRITNSVKMGNAACGAWMTTRIFVVKVNETLQEVSERAFTQHGFRELPVINENGVFLGMISMTALKNLDPVELEMATVSEFMDRKAVVVFPSTPMLEVERKFAENHLDYLPVIDSVSEKLMGVLSPTDVLRARQKVGVNLEKD